MNITKQITRRFVLIFPDFSRTFRQAHSFKSFQIINKFSSTEDDRKAIKLIRELGFCSIVFEELDTIDYPTKHRQDDPLHEIFTKSNHFRINLFATTQRLTALSIVARSQAHVIITFNQDDPDDKARLIKYLTKAEIFPSIPAQHFFVLKGQEDFNAISGAGGLDFKKELIERKSEHERKIFEYKRQNQKNEDASGGAGGRARKENGALAFLVER